ncbi:MAG TPA: glycosyltransferase family 4 protein [Candidatus Acidoferrales bacterium]
MPERRYRVLLVATHAVQYASPVFREMARDPRLDIEVAYCSLVGAEAGVDKEFGVEVKWDVPLLDGYPWTQEPNRARHPALGHFFGLVNTSLWRKIRKGRYDAVVLYTGYRYASFWIALAAAKISGAKIMFGTDATTIQLRDGPRLKSWLKPHILSFVFHRADATFGASVAGKEYLKTLGIPPERIGVVPLVVDNDWWLARSNAIDRSAVRASWGVPTNAPVVIFCGKLQPWKRPLDLLRAFAAAGVPGAHLVIAGDGPLANELTQIAAQLGISDRVHFLGFQNQSRLPAVYSSADLFVLPSKYDACPAVVCEAMLCGLPAVLSDEIRGRREQIDEGETGYIFPCGNVDALAEILRRTLVDPAKLASMGIAARRKMDSFSPATNVKAFLELLDATLEKPQAPKS